MDCATSVYQGSNINIHSIVLTNGDVVVLDGWAITRRKCTGDEVACIGCPLHCGECECHAMTTAGEIASEVATRPSDSRYDCQHRSFVRIVVEDCLSWGSSRKHDARTRSDK